MEKVLQRTGNVRECIFRASGGTNIENLPCQNQPWWDFRKVKHPDIRRFFKKCVVFEKKKKTLFLRIKSVKNNIQSGWIRPPPALLHFPSDCQEQFGAIPFILDK